MTDRIDHESAAFFVAAILFWAAFPFVVRWFPTLRVLWSQDSQPETKVKPSKELLKQLVWLVWGFALVAYVSHIHWTMPDTYRTMGWLAIFTAVAVLGLLMAKFWRWGLARMKFTEDQTH